jgi:Replication protein C C-terminal region
MPARANDKDWPAIVEAALFLSGEMGINRTLWSRACDVMGQEYAAVAMARVSTRPAEHFTSGPGGYFAGMLRKFEKNPQDLCLSRTLWKLKDETWGAQGHKERRERDKARRRSFAAEPAMTPGSGFMPVGTMLQRQAAAPTLPARQANPTPFDHRAAGSSAAWQPSAELRAAEERIKAMFAKPHNGTGSAAGPHEDKKN